jgi:hypothetical protein
MSAAVVQQIIARSVVDPTFLDWMNVDMKGALAGYELSGDELKEFRALDLARLDGLIGVVIKVQNNGLWQTFPYTRLAIDYYALDLDFFGDYQAQHQRDRTDARADYVLRSRHFTSFFSSWLNERDKDTFPCLRDVFLHERALFEHRIALKEPDPDLPQTASFDLGEHALLELVPVIRGLLLTERFEYNPGLVIEALSKDASLERIPRHDRDIAYWGDLDTSRIRMFEVDGDARSLLDRIDGTRSLQKMLPTSDAARAHLLQIFREMMKLGVLALRKV